MAIVKHTVHFVYGMGTGTATLFCNEGDDLETIKAKIVKQEGLNYLPMSEPKITNINTENRTDD